VFFNSFNYGRKPAVNICKGFAFFHNLSIILKIFNSGPPCRVALCEKCIFGNNLFHFLKSRIKIASVRDSEFSALSFEFQYTFEKIFFADTVSGCSFDNRNTEFFREKFSVNTDISLLCHVDHVESQHKGFIKLHKLNSKIQVTLKVGSINNVNYDIGVCSCYEIPRHYLFQ